MRSFVLVLVLLAACFPKLPAPKPPALQAIPPAVALPDQSLLPAQGPAFLASGKTLPYSASCFSNEQAAALAGELERLDGRDEAVQDAERAQAMIVLTQVNADLALLAKQYQEAYEAQQKLKKKLPYWLGASFVGGAVLVVAIGVAVGD